MPRRAPRSILARGVLLSFLSALVLAPSSASASVRTQWDTSPACVDADSLPTRVDALLAEPPSSPVRLSLGALAHDDAWQISMRVDGLPQPLTDLLLVGLIKEGEEQTHRHRLNIVGVQLLNQVIERPNIKRPNRLAVVIDALRNFKT